MISDQQAKQQIDQLSVSIRLYRSRKRKQADLDSQEKWVRGEIEEFVRQKIVSQLHDGLSQTVSALAMRINFAHRMMNNDPGAAREELEKVEALARDTTREIRHLIFILRPASPDSFKFTEALELLAEKLDELFNLRVELQVNDELVDQLPLVDQNIIYNLVEEAVDSARQRNGFTHLLVRLGKIDLQAAQLEIEHCGDFSEEIEFPFQIAELENIQEFSQLISGSVNVVDEGTKIQILFPLNEQSNLGTLPGS